MRFDLVTIFPEMFDALTRFGITGRALDRGLWSLNCWNPRDFASDAYRSVDDRPYGGGPGMVMLAEPIAAALSEISTAQQSCVQRGPVIHLSPRGRPLTHQRVTELVAFDSITLLASRYEAVDQRLLDHHVDEEISIGDFVVSGGELPAMMLIDAVVRLLPGALNDQRSAIEESFADGLLDCPHYTRPEIYEDERVPEVLLSGHHANIARWRREQSLLATIRRRPELLERARRDGLLTVQDERFLSSLRDKTA